MRRTETGRGPAGALPISTSSEGMAIALLTVPSSDVVFVKGIVEASDGLACVFAAPRAVTLPGVRPPGTPSPTASERTSSLVLAAPKGREAELRELVADLSALGTSL